MPKYAQIHLERAIFTYFTYKKLLGNIFRLYLVIPAIPLSPPSPHFRTLSLLLN